MELKVKNKLIMSKETFFLIVILFTYCMCTFIPDKLQGCFQQHISHLSQSNSKEINCLLLYLNHTMFLVFFVSPYIIMYFKYVNPVQKNKPNIVLRLKSI